MAILKRPEKLLIIIPAYNEQGAIHGVVSGVRQALPTADVLVINDGSVDNTAYEAATAGAIVVDHPFNLGIGGAVQTGLKFAREHDYDYVIRLDGDGQHDAAEIELFLQVLRERGADLVIGSRFLDADVDWHIPWARRIGINFFGWSVSLLIGERATDTTSGFCGMNRPAIDVLATYLPQDYPDVESRVLIHKAGLRQLELPVKMRARMAGVSSINTWKSVYYALKVSVAMLTSALKEVALGKGDYIMAFQAGAARNGDTATRSAAGAATPGAVAPDMATSDVITTDMVTPERGATSMLYQNGQSTGTSSRNTVSRKNELVRSTGYDA